MLILSQFVSSGGNLRDVNYLLISKIGFRWMNKLLGEGYKKELGIEDLYEVRQEDRSSVVGDSLERFVFIFSVFQSVLNSSV